MQLLDQPKGRVYVAEAPIWDPSCTSLQGRDHLLVGITTEALRAIAARGQTWVLGQLYGIIGPGLITSQRLYKGLRRGMYVNSAPNAAAGKLAATWAAKRDARLVGDRSSPTLEFSPAPPKAVFCLYISRNAVLTDYPAIYGWIEHWTWLPADSSDSDSPIDWLTRYDESVWPQSRVHA